MNKSTIIRWFLAALVGSSPWVGNAAQNTSALEPEVSDVATLKTNAPHRFFTSGWDTPSLNIYDADTGKLEGMLPSGYIPNLAIAPDNSRLYIAETYWVHGNRGDRHDMVSVYDAATLNLVKEIMLPSRALVSKVQNFDLNASGSRAYVYVMQPASSVVWVDLKKQAVGGSVEVPGCSLVFPWGEQGFASLCGDGSLALVTVPASGAAIVTHTKPFFDANQDPIFENSLVDRVTGKAIFISFTGLVYQTKLGSSAVIDKPWSIQQAAGYAIAGTGVQELAWRPGGRQLAAYHKASGKLFVLMHPGNYWTHKQGGTEVWVLDTHSHALLARFPLRAVPTSALGDERVPFYANIGVSQDDKPLLYLLNPEGNDLVLDANTGEQQRKIEMASGHTVWVPGF